MYLRWGLYPRGYLSFIVVITGLFNAKGERIAGDTELSIYQALGLRYQHPEERG